MPKFMFLHYGGEPPEGDEAKQQMMAAMGAWMQEVGDSIVDPGSPLGPAQSVGAEPGDPPNGYMVIEVADAAIALEVAKASPMAAQDGARLDVHEVKRG